MNSKQLLAQIERLKEVNSIKNNSTNAGDLQKIRERVEDDVFRVAVVGGFSAGKSTLINALIGKDILSHAVRETTAAITYIYNIPASDERLCTCEIVYHNGKKKVLRELAQLRDYTTAQSTEDVKNTIQSVSVFVPFLKTEQSIVMVDTPGLNGLTERHRDITVNEVKKAHACIYVLSVKGLTEADKDFIKFLVNYQTKFIFVQNFIDSFNASEGDTPEKKLQEDREWIDKILEETGCGVEYELCGVSARYALYSRDYNLKKIHGDRDEEITEEDRKEFYKMSGLAELEQLIRDMFANEKYKQVVIQSAVQALDTLINAVLPHLYSMQEINTELKKQDDKAKRIEKAQQVIDKINSTKEDRLRKLENFMISADRENRRGLKEHTRMQLEKLVEMLNGLIDSEIRSFDELNNFEVNYGESALQHFSEKAADILNSQLIPDVDRRIRVNLENLHEEAMQRAVEYSGGFTEKTERIHLEIEEKVERFKMDEIVNAQKTVNNMENERGQKEQELENRKVQYQKAEAVIEQASKERENNKEKLKEKEKYYEKCIKELGNRPEVEYYNEKRTRTVKKRFLVFPYEKEETYYERVQDDTKLREWLRRKRIYDEEISRQRTYYQTLIEKCNREIGEKEIEKKIGERDKGRLEEEIKYLKNRIEMEREIYREFEKNYKTEFFKAQIKRLKSAIADRLLHDEKEPSVVENLEKRIDTVSQKHLKTIMERVSQYFLESIEQQKESMKRMITENVLKLQEQFEKDQNEIAVLEDIRKILMSNG